jgi:hypothetical protein
LQPLELQRYLCRHIKHIPHIGHISHIWLKSRSTNKKRRKKGVLNQLSKAVFLHLVLRQSGLSMTWVTESQTGK